jgi:drug/metabolite transporter (DMT)-like permease
VLSMIVFADERVLARSRRFWSGLGLGLIGGVGVLMFKPGFVLGASPSGAGVRTILIGAVMVTTATALWSVYAVMVRLTMRGVDSRTAFAVIALETTLGLAVIASIWGQPGVVVTVPLRVIVLVALSGWICIALAHVCYYTAIQRIGVAVPTAVLQLTPFAVLSLSYLIFDERLATAQLASGVVLVAGAGLALWAQEQIRRRQRSSNADRQEDTSQ